MVKGFFKAWIDRLRWMLGFVTLDGLPFEELLHDARFPFDKRYQEFCRRLVRLVRLATVYYKRRSDPAADPDKTTARIFSEFAGQCLACDPRLVLVEFARVIRQATDGPAFTRIRGHFYRMLLVYHLPNAEQRRVMQVLTETALSFDEEAVAAGLGMSVERMVKIAASANQRIEKIARTQFPPGELEARTEGTEIP